MLLKVKETKLQLELDKLETEKSILQLDSAIKSAKTDFPFDVKKYVALKSDLESYKEGLKVIEDLIEEFGFNKD